MSVSRFGPVLRMSYVIAMTLGLACVLRVDAAVAEGTIKLKLLKSEKIWDEAPHNAFTDLVRWRDRWYCGFREGKGHAGDRGLIRIITSEDGEEWSSAATLEHPEFDLRDAALSVTPDDRLMALFGSQHVVDGTRRTGTFASFSEDGKEFTTPERATPQGRWLWRVTWHDGKAYGVAYATPDDHPYSSLLVSESGVDYEAIQPQLLGEGWPTEARVRFADDGTCYCLHRRDRGENAAYWGVATAPYKDWTWNSLGRYVGGPNFIQLPSGQWVGCGRLIDGAAHTELFTIDVENGEMSESLLRLPSGGDTSYPGMEWHDGRLWVSYYASHEGKTSIYLAQVEVTE